MKINRYKTLIIVMFCLMAISCKKDFLQLVPEGQKVAQHTDDYRLLMADPSLSIYNFAGGWQGEVMMGDDVAAESSMFDQAQYMSQAAFKWNDLIFRSEDVDWSTKLWLGNLYQLNKVINEVENSPGGTASLKNTLLAQAHANRAWIYFQLINIFAKPYNAASAAGDPGFPIILTADITVDQFTRNSVQEVYDFIIKEFNSAIPNLPVNSSNPIYFSKSAAEGLLGKVYLSMNKPTEALAAFNNAFSGNAAKASPAVLYDYNVEFGPTGKFMPINYDGPSNSPGNNLYDYTESLISKRFYNGANNGNGFGNDPFVMDPKTRLLFNNADLRLNFYAPEFPWSTPNPSGRLRKYGVTYTYFGLQLSELYLLRAEARAKLNDLTGAVGDLVALRSKRMPAAVAAVPSNIANDRTALIKFVFDERQREFAMEGYRWFDMRRQSVDPLFDGKVYSHTIYNFEAQTSTSFTLAPNRLTLKIPLNITDKNPNLVNNP
jgi:tetratricopeptide (TPR) repeat protein